MRPTWALASLLLLAVYADGAENGSKPVQVKIGTILASNESDQFDARLKPMERQLKVMKYRSYRLLKEDSQSVPVITNAEALLAPSTLSSPSRATVRPHVRLV